MIAAAILILAAAVWTVADKIEKAGESIAAAIRALGERS